MPLLEDSEHMVSNCYCQPDDLQCPIELVFLKNSLSILQTERVDKESLLQGLYFAFEADDIPSLLFFIG